MVCPPSLLNQDSIPLVTSQLEVITGARGKFFKIVFAPKQRTPPLGLSTLRQKVPYYTRLRATKADVVEKPSCSMETPGGARGAAVDGAGSCGLLQAGCRPKLELPDPVGQSLGVAVTELELALVREGGGRVRQPPRGGTSLVRVDGRDGAGLRRRTDRANRQPGVGPGRRGRAAAAMDANAADSSRQRGQVGANEVGGGLEPRDRDQHASDGGGVQLAQHGHGGDGGGDRRKGEIRVSQSARRATSVVASRPRGFQPAYEPLAWAAAEAAATMAAARPTGTMAPAARMAAACSKSAVSAGGGAAAAAARAGGTGTPAFQAG